MSETSAGAGLPGLFLPFGQTSGEAAFQQWSETVATVYDLGASRDDIRDFRFGFSAWHFGSLVLGVSETDKIKLWRSPQTVARSGIDHYLVQVYEQGRFSSRVEGKEMVVETGDVWIVDLSRSVKNEQASFRSTNLAIPRSVLAPLLLIGLTQALEPARLRPHQFGTAAGRSFVDMGQGIFYRLTTGAVETKKRQPPVPLPPRLLAHLRRRAAKGIVRDAVVEWNGQPRPSPSEPPSGARRRLVAWTRASRPTLFAIWRRPGSCRRAWISGRLRASWE